MWATSVCAQDNTSSRISNTETEPYYFVPSLAGALGLAGGIRARRVTHINGGSQIPPLDATARLGYRTYIDDWSRVLASAWLEGTTSINTTAGQGRLSSLSLVFDGQLRGLNSQFLGVLLNTTLQIGPAFWSPPSVTPNSTLTQADPLGESQVGWRAEASLAIGFGMMTSFNPYTFAESPIRFGVEWVNLGGGTSWTVITLGFEVCLDVIHR
ncbi:MAG: hypothetical protein AAFX99_06360 [Myxococcota bacterium]